VTLDNAIHQQCESQQEQAKSNYLQKSISILAHIIRKKNKRLHNSISHTNSFTVFEDYIQLKQNLSQK